MRIQSIYAESYGLYESCQVSEEQLSAPVTVFYGHNEVGKSTLHSLIRSILFGFRSKGSIQSYLSVNTYGRLAISDNAGTELHIERKCPPKNGRVTVYDHHGQALEEGEAAVQKILGGISAPLFSNIFCFSHQELQRLETLQGEEVSAYLHSAAMGAGGMSLLELERKMIKQQEQLFKPKATNPELNQLLSQLEEEQQQILMLQKSLERYKPVQIELEQAKASLHHYKDLRGQLEKEKAYYEVLLQAAELTQKRRRVEAVIKGLQQEPVCLLPYEAELINLHMLSAVISEKQEERTRTDNQLQQLQEQISLGIVSLGAGWSVEKVRDIDLSLPAKEELLQIIENVDRTENKLQTLQDKLTEKKETAQRAEQKHRDLEKRLLDQTHNSKGIKAGRMKREDSRHTGQNKLWFVPSLFGLALSVYLWLQGHLVEGGTVGAGALLLFYFMYQWVKKVKEQQKRWEEHLQKQEGALSQQNILVATAKQDADYELGMVDEYEKKVRECESELQAAHHRGMDILAAWGIPPIGRSIRIQNILHTIEKIQQDLFESKKLLQRKGQLEEEIRDWELQIKVLSKKLFNSQHEKAGAHALLELLLKELEREREQDRKIKEQKSVLAQIAAEYEGILEQLPANKREFDGSHVQNELTKTDIEEKIKQLTDDNEQMIEQTQQLAQKVGNLEQVLNQIEKADSLALLQHEYEQKKALFREKAKTWTAYSIARALCAKTRKIYEEERQPAVLKQASYFFAAFTEQRYQQVIAPIGEQELVVVDQQGKRWPSSILSKGTKEQLYLAMRFALIKEYEKQANLPIILDDPFVHFDQMRLKQVFQGIMQLASSHQVILFTCHQHYLELFQEIDREQSMVRIIDLEQPNRTKVRV